MISETKSLESSPIGRAERLLAEARRDPRCLSDLEGSGVVAELEQAFARVAGSRWALALCSGTCALEAMLLGCGIGPGDEVVVSCYGWGQTVGAVLACGATPVFGDIRADTLDLDPASVEGRISPRTRAILVTHVFGQPANLPRLGELAQSHGMWLLADAAQALGAEIDGTPLAAMADATAYSLGRGKLVDAGEGGILATSNPDILEQAIALTQHPLRASWDIEDPVIRASVGEFGRSWRIHGVGAALALDGLERMGERLAERRVLASSLAERMERWPDVQVLGERPGTRHAFHALPLRCGGPSGTSTEVSRNSLIAELHAAGIPALAGPVGLPLHLRPPFRAPSGESNPSRAVLRLDRTHPTWLPGSSPVAERYCEGEELVIRLTDVGAERGRMHSREAAA